MHSPGRLPREGLWQAGVAAAAVVYMVGATAWSLPGNTWPQRVARGSLSTLFRSLGLWQNWNMFAPVPKHVDEWVAAVVTFDDGSTVEWPLSRMKDLGWLDRYRKDRWRKYFGDEFPKARMQAAWDPACRWLAAEAVRTKGASSPPVVQVELVQYSRSCLLPPAAWSGWNAALEARPYRTRTFHVWRAGVTE